MPQISTTHQLLRVVEYISDSRHRGFSVGAVFLDIAKAFDRVWIQGLVHKLIINNFPDYLIKTLQSYLTSRKFFVQIKDKKSTSRPIECGVPQGSLIGPVLFLIYINDIPQHPRTMLSLFADDTAIICKGNCIQMPSRINHHLKLIERWLSQWKILVNVEKTEAIKFTKKEIKPITLHNQKIPWKETAKYLGVMLDSQLTWKAHISYISNKFKEVRRKLYLLISYNSKLSRKNKILVYKYYLRPIISYAAPVRGYAAKTNFLMLQRLENSIIRTIGRARWFMRTKDIRKALRIPDFKMFVKKIAVKFFNGLPTHPNIEVSNIPEYNQQIKKFHKRPRALIF